MVTQGRHVQRGIGSSTQIMPLFFKGVLGVNKRYFRQMSSSNHLQSDEMNYILLVKSFRFKQSSCENRVVQLQFLIKVQAAIRLHTKNA